MNLDSLKAAYRAALIEQAEARNKPRTPFDDAIAQAVLNAAVLAMADVAGEHTAKRFRYSSAETGAGKTTPAVALIAAGFRIDPDFAAAYVVPPSGLPMTWRLTSRR